MIEFHDTDITDLNEDDEWVVEMPMPDGDTLIIDAEGVSLEEVKLLWPAIQNLLVLFQDQSREQRKQQSVQA